MIFTTCLDGSGIHKGSEDVILAGYVSTLTQWEAFESEWRNEISEYGLEYFHMTDFASRKKQYKVWDEQERESRFARLVEIINTHTVCSVAVVVPRLEYAAAMKKNWKAIPSQVYGFATGIHDVSGCQ